MAAAGMVRVGGLSWQSNIYHRPKLYHNPSSLSFSPNSVRCCIKMADSDNEKKKKASSLSQETIKAGKELMPGGVNSPVRAFKAVEGDPFAVGGAKGSKLRDRDGNEYIDYVNAFGAIILGHADDEVNAALSEASKKGLSFGAPCHLENVLAEMVILAVPSIEMVRFVNSGTEACMSVIRLARAFTGREKFIMFDGNYHGHCDYFLVKPGGGPNSAGVPKFVTSLTLTCPYNDISAVKKLFESNKGDIAAVILEPVVGNSGFISPKPGFLEELRRITNENDSLLIFDEVMTGFRVSYGGAQEYFGVTPDLTTLGKIIGGGLPVGAYGGKKSIMEMVAPAGPVYQAGTFCGNPSTMSTGIQTLKQLKHKGSYEYLNTITSKLVLGLIEVARKYGHEMCGGCTGGMFGFFFTKGPVYHYEDACKNDKSKYASFHRGMLDEGVNFPPSPFEAAFTSLVHSSEDIERTIRAAERIFRKI